MKKIRLIIFSAFISSTTTFAQITISGVVPDAATNQPIVNVKIQTSLSTVVTNKSGLYEIKVQGTNDTVIFSHVGYQTKKIRFTNTDEFLTVYLNAANTSLNAVEIIDTLKKFNNLIVDRTQVLTGAALSRGNGLYLDDVINQNMPGVTMQRRGNSSGQQFNIRGYGNGVGGSRLNSNFDTQGAKVYLNGIPITDAEGITLMDDIDFASIGTVAVTKGPAGSLYGLAIAGAVSLETVKPDKGISIGEDMLVGDYGTQRFTTSIQAGGEKGSLLLNYGHQTSDGYMVHTASHKDFVSMSGVYKVDEKQSVHTFFGYSNSYDQRGGELTMAQYNNFDYSGNPDYIKRNGHSEIISFRMGVSDIFKLNENFSTTTTVFGSGVSNNSSSAAGWTDKNPINYGVRSTINLGFDFKNKTHLSGVVGIENQKQNAQIIGYNMVQNPQDTAGYWIIGTARSNQQTTTATTTLFTRWILTLPKDFSMLAGLGYSNMNIALQDKFYVATNKNPTNYATTYDGMLSPNIELNKKFGRDINVYASYSRGYKAPVSSYFFIPTTGQLNTGLKPEIGDQFEIGTRGTVGYGKLYYALALFSTKFQDKMTAIAVPLNSTTTAYTYVANAGNQNDNGIELVLKYQLCHSGNNFFQDVTPFFNFAYSDFKYDGYGFQTLSADKKTAVIADYSGKSVAGVAPLTANLGIDFITKPGVYGNVVYAYKDAMPITSDGLNKTAAYSLLNAKLGYKTIIAKHFGLDIYAGVNNITGAQYAAMVFVNQIPDAYLPAPYKANYFGGVNVKYNF